MEERCVRAVHVRRRCGGVVGKKGNKHLRRSGLPQNGFIGGQKVEVVLQRGGEGNRKGRGRPQGMLPS